MMRVGTCLTPQLLSLHLYCVAWLRRIAINFIFVCYLLRSLPRLTVGSLFSWGACLQNQGRVCGRVSTYCVFVGNALRP
eukprot:4966301-Amphidinium_carterae.1